jgi:hypothetical protein
VADPILQLRAPMLLSSPLDNSREHTITPQTLIWCKHSRPNEGALCLPLPRRWCLSL